uniref:Putative HNH endonuclease n=2 Tax=Ignatiaceae TaxID=2682551 RepID=A0A1W6EGW2_9CHLO|nr:putative HNH endonuclease [Pseudocharacium americanum]YP_009367676.1 putative HNH endonuclease [Ignatius tetrasporus]ARK14633.1 putative HNH endonuclease [Pseudocharacium americanum]ARK14722.1 putative HNH endonuclease [Ignatius tetrasporus]
MWAPLTSIELEDVKFNIQKLMNSEITGIEYKARNIMDKRVHGFETADWVKGKALSPQKNAKRPQNPITRTIYGRVIKRATGFFDVNPKNGGTCYLSYKKCLLIQKCDGYSYV